ncbi:uncharacterized protein LOC133385213 isoform X1 [Rhineura floridana]|uniref:uncharacterized protein LOC133385213 isoform X1 n=1 Tax=Rhineura floridana TaxID=261503 RepID=UPI002AC82AAA|nr:uncharacterized protein LOC133385213 isoform X1 [Rhineura floridana]
MHSHNYSMYGFYYVALSCILFPAWTRPLTKNGSLSQTNTFLKLVQEVVTQFQLTSCWVCAPLQVQHGQIPLYPLPLTILELAVDHPAQNQTWPQRDQVQVKRRKGLWCWENNDGIGPQLGYSSCFYTHKRGPWQKWPDRIPCLNLQHNNTHINNTRCNCTPQGMKYTFQKNPPCHCGHTGLDDYWQWYGLTLCRANSWTTNIPDQTTMLRWYKGDQPQAWSEIYIASDSWYAKERKGIDTCMPTAPGVTRCNASGPIYTEPLFMSWYFTPQHGFQSHLNGTLQAHHSQIWPLGKCALKHHWFVCGTTAYTCLPPDWRGSCYVAYLIPNINVKPKGQHIFRPLYTNTRDKRHALHAGDHNWGSKVWTPQDLIDEYKPLTWSSIGIVGARSMTNGLLRLQAVVEVVTNATGEAIRTLTQETEQIRKRLVIHQQGLDLLLASSGGLCATLNTSGECCVEIGDESQVINQLVDHAEITAYVGNQQWKGLNWDWLTSWLPNWAWLKHLFVIGCIIFLILMCLPCIISCVSGMLIRVMKRKAQLMMYQQLALHEIQGEYTEMAQSHEEVWNHTVYAPQAVPTREENVYATIDN